MLVPQNMSDSDRKQNSSEAQRKRLKTQEDMNSKASSVPGVQFACK